MKIGIMDSGVGGLTVLKECLVRLPEHEYIYYADSKHAPYGTKTRDEVYELTANAVDFLVGLGCEIVVLACNTATSAAAVGLRLKYTIPIVGMEPAIKPALEFAQNRRVLVTATELTLSQPKFTELIEKLDVNSRVDFLPLTELVEFAEQGMFDVRVVTAYLEEKLAHLDLDLYGSVVLGCTHFPLFKGCFEAVLPFGTAVVDGSVGTTKRVKEFAKSPSKTPSLSFFLSGEPILEGKFFERVKRIIAQNDI